MQQYIEISITPLSDEEQDILMAWMSDLGFYGFQKGSDVLLAYIKEADYVTSEVDEVIPEGKSVTIRKIEEINWNKKWESEFTPVVIDQFLAIRAAFHQPIHTTPYEIVITPKMSFGTGHHATTSLMIRQMKTVDFKDKSVIDFGTGTGVLAILAEKMGAKDIVAIDKDEWSIENAEENIQTNHCSKISVLQASDPAGETVHPADIVLANITADVLLQHASALKALTKNNGLLILAGFLEKDAGTVLARFEDEHFRPDKLLKEEDWRCISFVKGE